MSSITLNGDISGSVILAAPSVAGSTTLTLPTTSGTLALTASPTFTGQATIPTINLTGGQITFPATQVPSSDANTLDDYEEGTWTPTLTGASSVTLTPYGAQTYIKIGRQVICYFDVSVASNSVGSQANIGGLPFTASSASTYFVGINGYNNINALGYWAWIVNGNSTTAGANYVNNNSGTQVPPSSMSGARMIGSLLYLAAA